MASSIRRCANTVSLWIIRHDCCDDRVLLWIKTCAREILSQYRHFSPRQMIVITAIMRLIQRKITRFREKCTFISAIYGLWHTSQLNIDSLYAFIFHKSVCIENPIQKHYNIITALFRAGFRGIRVRLQRSISNVSRPATEPSHPGRRSCRASGRLQARGCESQKLKTAQCQTLFVPPQLNPSHRHYSGTGTSAKQTGYDYVTATVGGTSDRRQP